MGENEVYFRNAVYLTLWQYQIFAYFCLEHCVLIERLRVSNFSEFCDIGLLEERNFHLATKNVQRGKSFWRW